VKDVSQIKKLFFVSVSQHELTYERME